MQEMWAVPTSFIFAAVFMYKQTKFQRCYFMVIKEWDSIIHGSLKLGYVIKTLRGKF